MTIAITKEYLMLRKFIRPIGLAHVPSDLIIIRIKGVFFMGAFDFKKEYKAIYQPKQIPSILEIGEMTYMMVDGKGNPNTSEAYQEAIELLYGIAYGIKMSKKQEVQPKGYFDFVVPPLEGFWDIEPSAFDGEYILDKNKLTWTSMIRVPDFVTQEVFEEQKQKILKKKPHLSPEKIYRKVIAEGLCVQILHVGSYDDEARSIKKIDEFAEDQGYAMDITETRRHHEIYLSDYRKTEASKLKTIIRHPIK